MYPELITRPDVKVFLPPIGNLTVYICTFIYYIFFTAFLTRPTVGNPAFMSDESKELTLRVHDECSFFFHLPHDPPSHTSIYRQRIRRHWLRYMHMQTLPHLRHRGVHTRCTERRCGHRRVFPERRQGVGRGYKVRLFSTFLIHYRPSKKPPAHPSRYLVYNLRKRGGDSADKYFKSTEMIASVKDIRFQALMLDVLHWLGIKKVDKMVSMSDMS